MNDLEKFLKRQPLNEHMAALMNGEEPEPEPVPDMLRRQPQDASGAFDDNDREHLRRLTLEPGWPILLILLDKDLRREEELVKQTSKLNPLANKDQIAADWAYVGIMERVRAKIETLVQAEITLLENDRARGRDGD